MPNDAGPLILMPSILLREWSGIDVPPDRTVSATFRWNVEEPRASDYDRACDINDYAGVIPVGNGEGLVLNDAPSATAWMAREWGGLLLRWEYAEDDSAMEEALAEIPNELAWDSKGYFRILGTPQALFNSAEPGMEPVLPRLELELPEDVYEVRWVRYAPDVHTAVGLIELRRADHPPEPSDS